MSHTLITQNVNPHYHSQLASIIAAGLESSAEYVPPPLVSLIAHYAMSRFVRIPVRVDYVLRGYAYDGPASEGHNMLVLLEHHSYKLVSSIPTSVACPRMEMACNRTIYFSHLNFQPRLRNEPFFWRNRNFCYCAPLVHGDFSRHFGVNPNGIICDPSNDRMIVHSGLNPITSAAMDPSGKYLFLSGIASNDRGYYGVMYTLPHFDQAWWIASGLPAGEIREIKITANDAVLALSSFANERWETEIWNYREQRHITTFSGPLPRRHSFKVVLGDDEIALVGSINHSTTADKVIYYEF